MRSPKTAAVYPLKGYVQHYSWGGTQFIPRLLGIDNQSGVPYAELWLGTHPRGPAQIYVNGSAIPLRQFIDRAPEACLGERVSQRFNKKLPFLFKVLDVQTMLSIQAHPSKQQAEAGYRKENALGIPLDASHRIFKDDNHKPEVMVALSDFWLLHGFQSKDAIKKNLRQTKEWQPLLSAFSDDNIAGLYRTIMEMPQPKINRMLHPMAERLPAAMREGRLSKDQPAFWAARAFEEYASPAGDYDRGIFSIFLLNLVHLKKGEGIFQDAGIPHAYLEGVNVELMANSDNVFRGGLTKKHVDGKTLMEHLDFRSVQPDILKGEQTSETERIYPTPVPDFRLSRIRVTPDKPHVEKGRAAPEILLVLKGSIQIGEDLTLQRGNCCFVAAESPIHIRSEEEAVLFKATVPV